MEALSEKDVARLHKAMAHTNDPSFFQHLRNLLRARLTFDTFLILRFTANGAVEALDTWIQDPVLRQKYSRQYLDGAYQLDPFFQYRHAASPGGLFLLSEIAPDRFTAGEYYLQYYRQTQIHTEVGLLVDLSDGATGHLSFSRLNTLGPFRSKELRCLRHYSPVLMELLRQYCEYRAVSASDTSAASPEALPDRIRKYLSRHRGTDLTRREAEMAGLILQGHSNLSASLTMGISRQTAKVHRRNIYRKLSISSQTELFAMLIELF